MTETATAPATPGDRYDELRDFVRDRVESLQRRALESHQVARATAELAQLRHAVGREPGADPNTWQLTLEGLPRQYTGRDDEVSNEERAVHAAMTLYAVHQQSRGERMHRRGPSFGRAASALARSGNEAAVLRRFQALATADSLAEMLHHSRGLITQFRSHGVPLDYGRFCVDLVKMQRPATADRVRLAWGRDYYFTPAEADDTTTQPNGDEQ